MNTKQILQSRANQKTRLARPFQNFYASFNQCLGAGQAILDGSFAPEFVPLLERSVVISGVTAIEVYFRDTLDLIFKYCSPEFFRPRLRAIHADKYDIDELLDLYIHRIHPLELVVDAQSFQNTEKIEKIFSKFVPTGLWSAVMQLQVRIKEQPEKVAVWKGENLVVRQIHIVGYRDFNFTLAS